MKITITATVNADDDSEFLGKYIDLTEDDVGKNPKDIPILDVE